jgi:hypothetical protein
MMPGRSFYHTLIPGPEMQGQSGWVDIPYEIRAYRRANGELLGVCRGNAKGKDNYVSAARFKTSQADSSQPEAKEGDYVWVISSSAY